MPTETLEPPHCASCQRGPSTGCLTGAQQSWPPRVREAGTQPQCRALSDLSGSGSSIVSRPPCLLPSFSCVVWGAGPHTALGSALWETQNLALPLPSPRYLPEGETTSLHSIQIPAGMPPALQHMVSQSGGLPMTHPSTWPLFCFDYFCRSKWPALTHFPELLVWWPRWGTDLWDTKKLVAPGEGATMFLSHSDSVAIGSGAGTGAPFVSGRTSSHTHHSIHSLWVLWVVGLCLTHFFLYLSIGAYFRMNTCLYGL